MPSVSQEIEFYVKYIIFLQAIAVTDKSINELCPEYRTEAISVDQFENSAFPLGLHRLPP